MFYTNAPSALFHIQRAVNSASVSYSRQEVLQSVLATLLPFDDIIFPWLEFNPEHLKNLGHGKPLKLNGVGVQHSIGNR